MSKMKLKHFYMLAFLLEYILSPNADIRCYPRWLPGSKSRIHVTFVPIKKDSTKWETRPILDFQSMSIRFPKDMKEVLSCRIDPKTKIQIRCVMNISYWKKAISNNFKVFHTQL